MEGWLETDTLYELPPSMLVAKVKEPLEETTRLSPELFWRVTEPERPETVPPMV